MADFTGFFPSGPSFEILGLTADSVGTLAPTADLKFYPYVFGWDPDVVAPVVSSAPSPGAGAISPSQSISVTIDDDRGLRALVVYAIFGSRSETIYDYENAVRFQAPYSSSTDTPSGNSRALVITRTGGWFGSFTLRIEMVDSGGNLTETETAYTITPDPSLAPTIDFPGTHTRAPTDYAAVEVTDADGTLTTVEIEAVFSNRTERVRYGASGGGTILTPYTINASNISNGRRYEVSRTGGWYEAFTLRVVSVDGFGNTSTGTQAFTLSPSPTTGPAIAFTAPYTRAFGDSIIVEVTDVDGSLATGSVQIEAEYDEPADGSDVVRTGLPTGGGGIVVDPYLVMTTVITNGYRYEITRDGGGWKGDLSIRVRAEDGFGNTSMAAQAYEIDPENPDFLGDIVAPVVSNVTPTPGTVITRSTPVGADITDNGTFRRIIVAVFYPATGLTEMVHDGDAFRGFYALSSTREPISGGFRYRVLRDGGWPSAPTLQAWPIDTRGNEGS
jgi:hypothetical protein